MAQIPLSAALRREYERLFNTCQIRVGKAAEVESLVSQIRANQPRYEDVGNAVGVPWDFIAVIHCMESSLDFRKHLHNGDPLTARTVQVPSGRPKVGGPPFTWEESASDALTFKRLGAHIDWSLAGMLYQLERYNGFGYRQFHPQVQSPYLWSYSNQYVSGKYVKDGLWSDTAVSKQCGAAVLLRRMAENGQTRFVDQPVPADDAPLIVRYVTSKPGDPLLIARTEALQRWLNGFPGIFVKVDGEAGPRTSAAYRQITGSYLPGDPRG